MGYYSAGDIIRKTREAVGMTQEDLCDGICAVKNLSMMENNRSKVKLNTYRRLMARMERIPEKIYAVGLGKNMEVLEERYYVETFLKKQEYEKANAYLNEMEKKIGDDVINQQYIIRMRALIDYRLGIIGDKQLLQKLEEAIELTLPDYRNKIRNGIPLTEQEMQLTMNIGNAYAEKKDYERAAGILKELLTCIKGMNLLEQQYSIYAMPIINAIARISYDYYKDEDGAKKGHYEALELARKNNNGTVIFVIKSDLIDLDVFTKKDKEMIKKELRRAYYFAAARKDERFIEIIGMTRKELEEKRW